MDLLLAFVIAVPLAALLLVVCALISRWGERRMLQEMARAACPKCGTVVGLRVVMEGKDCSPWEEFEVGEGGDLVHWHPDCRSVRCGRCAHCFVIRLNRDGDCFGPRLSIEESDVP
jgi:hypothetical protein